MRNIKYLRTILALSAIILAITIITMAGNFRANENPVFQKEEPQVITTNAAGKGLSFVLEFEKGKSHNHPLMAVWAETLDGEYIQTFYVAQSIATSIFDYGEQVGGKWQPGKVRRPAALPYWSYKRGVKAPDGLYLPTPDNPVPDAYTAATPSSDFLLKSRFDEPLEGKFRLLFEINQSWDWNEYWTTTRYPDDKEYKTSSQPAIVYACEIDGSRNGKYEMKPIGHSHYSGKDGSLTTDISTLTTAMEIVKTVTVRVENK